MTGARAIPLRRRIVTATALVTAGGMAVLLVGVQLLLGRVVGDSVDGALRDRAEAVIATLQLEDADQLSPPDATDALESLVWIYDPAGRPVGERLPRILADTVESLSMVRGVRTAEEAGYRLRAAPIVPDDSATVAGVVVVAAELAPYRTTQTSALLLTVVLAVLVIAGVSALAAWIVGRALRPVHRMATSAAQWSEEDLTRRFGLGEPRDEITALAAVLDGLLERVSRTILAEQRLTSELAHELRSPLTVIRAEAELGAAGGTDRERFTRIVSSVDMLTAAIDTLLALARGGIAPDERSSAAEVLREAADRVGGNGRMTIEADGALTLAVPEDLAIRAVAPLVDNALRHGAGAVTLRARGRDDVVEITVADGGRLQAGEPEALFAPGVRGVESSGAGLGLPLARRLARAAGGDVRLESADPTTFVLTLPRVRARAERSPER
jgi:two-component system, OmpR family, sensor kinase